MPLRRLPTGADIHSRGMSNREISAVRMPYPTNRYGWLPIVFIDITNCNGSAGNGTNPSD